MHTQDDRQDHASAPTYADLRRRVLAFGAVFSVLVLALAGLGFLELRRNALRSAEQRAQSYSHILAAHLDRVMGAMDARLEQIVLRAPELGGPRGPARQWRQVLEAARAGSSAIGSLSVIDENGVIRHSTLPAIIGENRDDRFLNSALARSQGELMSDEPMRSAFNNKWILPFGRRLPSPSGDYAGGVVATFAPESLSSFYRAIDTDGVFVRVLHVTGAIVVDEPSSGTFETGADDPVMRRVRTGLNSGMANGALAAGGPDFITAFSTVSSTGLIVSVSLRRSDALAEWRLQGWSVGAILLGVLAAFWIAVGLMLNQLKARAAAETALLEQQQRFAATQRMEALGQLTGGVAHDFNNLLTVIISSADSLASRVSDESRARVDAILHAAENGAALIRQLLAFSRRQTLRIAPVDVNSIVASMEDMVRRTLGARVEVAFALAPDLWRAYGDRAQIEGAVLNLVINARDAMPDGGKLTIETRNDVLDEAYAAQNAEVASGDYVSLAVTDTGTGMSPEVLERAMEPFFTTKDVGRGSGLGLSMVFGFAKQSKGHLKIYSEVGRGTTVRLYLPRDVSAELAAETPHIVGEDRGGDETILLVEDEAAVRALAVEGLRQRGYTVIEASNGEQAKAILESDPRQIHLLLTDIIMPGALTGREVAEHALAARPGIKLLFTSGYADASVMRNGLLKAGARFLSKPYRTGELARVVRALLDS